MARKTDLAALLAPLKGYAFSVTPSTDGGIDTLAIGNGTVDRRIGAEGAYRMDGPTEVVYLLNNGHREWCLQIGRRDALFTASPAAAVKRLLKLTKALEVAGLVAKPPAEFRPYVETFDATGERVYTDIFPA